MIILLTLIWAPASFGETLQLAGVENVSPLIFEENGQMKGLDYDIWMELSKRLGVQANIQLLPFKRLWSNLQTGELDGTLQIYYNADRENEIIYSKTPMHWSAHYIIVRKEDLPKYTTGTLEGLYGKTVGKNAGFFVTKEFEEAVKAGKITVDEQVSSELNLKKLVAGRIDCYVSNLHSAMWAAKQLGIQDKIAPLPQPFAEKKGTFFAVSKKSKNIADKEGFMAKVNDELAKMHADGTVDRLSEKYVK
jgi:polar amino acid transport system substrate-binding protein